jgi:hypothetical protein
MAVNIATGYRNNQTLSCDLMGYPTVENLWRLIGMPITMPVFSSNIERTHESGNC